MECLVDPMNEIHSSMMLNHDPFGHSRRARSVNNIGELGRIQGNVNRLGREFFRFTRLLQHNTLDLLAAFKRLICEYD
ncbi:hypothetical protein D3C72_2023930 [compost metagenome]